MKYFVVSEKELRRLESAVGNLSGTTDSVMELGAAQATCRARVLPSWLAHLDKTEADDVTAGVIGQYDALPIVPCEFAVGDHVSFYFCGFSAYGDIVFIDFRDDSYTATVELDKGSDDYLNGWTGNQDDEHGGIDPECRYWLVPVECLDKV